MITYSALPKQDNPPILPTASLVSNSTHLRVLEIYPAVQGEGLLTGVPSTFVRLAGCSVGCEWCDTKYSWKAQGGELMTPEDLAGRIQEVTTHGHVVITGGEPLEHPHELLEQLFDAMDHSIVRHVTFETSGVVRPPKFLARVALTFDILLSVAPKLSGANTHYELPDLSAMLGMAYANRGIKLQVKYVLTGQADLREALGHLRDNDAERRYLWQDVSIILQPCTIFDRDEQVVREQIARDTAYWQEYITNTRWGATLPASVMVRPQFHAVLYGSKRGI